jgi:hypothetical protein
MKTYSMYSMAILLISVFGCKEDKQQKNTPSELSSRKSINNTVRADRPYLAMPMMLTAAGAQQAAASALENDFIEKAADAQYDWKYFDNIYQTQTGLSETDKERLSYTVLCSKDLVAQTGEDAAKRRHIAQLVNGNYKGYCLLYYALRSLSSAAENVSFINQMKTAIITAYDKDPSIKAMQNFDLNNVFKAEDAKRIQGVKNNYGYIEQVKSL